MSKKKSAFPARDSTANAGFETKLWLTAEPLPDLMEAAEYKHVVLGLFFLKYISEIRYALIESDLVDCVVVLPGQIFHSTLIPVSVWFLTKNKSAEAKRGFRDRSVFENEIALTA